MDYKSYGLPDMSYHGTKAWYGDFSHFNRHFSTMYCGKYAMDETGSDEADMYIAYNMYWEEQSFAFLQQEIKGNGRLLFQPALIRKVKRWAEHLMYREGA